MFGSRDDKRYITELVVFLRATLLETPKVDLSDQRVYTLFLKTQDNWNFHNYRGYEKIIYIRTFVI